MNKLIFLLAIFFLLSSVSAFCDSGQVDVNSASLEELDRLYGIGPAKSRAIINERPYNNLDDLTNAYGIGEVTLSNIKFQGLACVKDGKEEKENSNVENDQETSEVLENKVKTNTESKIVELEVIALSQDGEKEKDIKTDNVSEFQEKKNDYAVYGFVAFSILIVFLFAKAWRNKFKYKNEFDKE